MSHSKEKVKCGKSPLEIPKITLRLFDYVKRTKGDVTAFERSNVRKLYMNRKIFIPHLTPEYYCLTT